LAMKILVQLAFLALGISSIAAAAGMGRQYHAAEQYSG